MVAAHVDLASLAAIPRRWLPTAARETPSVRAILVLDMDHDDHDVLAFASRAPGPEDDTFRRLLVTRLLPQLNLGGAVEELRHLHHVVDGQSLLDQLLAADATSGQRYLVVAWHDVPRLVHDVMPRLYRDIGRGNSRMNVVDEEGRIVFGPPIKGGEFTVGRPFPTTLYNWRLQMALASAEQLGPSVERQRVMEVGIVGLAALVAIAGVVIVVTASVKERRLAALKSDFVANVSHELKTPALAGAHVRRDAPLGPRRRATRSGGSTWAIIVSRERAAHGAHRERARLRQGGARQGGLRVRARAASARWWPARSRSTATAPSARGWRSRSGSRAACPRPRSTPARSSSR